MEPIRIIGKNYQGNVERTRVACRAIIIKKGRILLSCATRYDLWMLPGGGLETGETEIECCAREVAEETGLVFRPTACVLTVEEYYKNNRYNSLYYTGRIVGQTKTKLTEDEKNDALAPRWLSLDAALALFAEYPRYEGVDELRHGLYLREYAALSAFLHRS